MIALLQVFVHGRFVTQLVMVGGMYSLAGQLKMWNCISEDDALFPRSDSGGLPERREVEDPAVCSSACGL
jgi:hypothetical protein